MSLAGSRSDLGDKSEQEKGREKHAPGESCDEDADKRESDRDAATHDTTSTMPQNHPLSVVGSSHVAQRPEEVSVRSQLTNIASHIVHSESSGEEKDRSHVVSFTSSVREGSFQPTPPLPPAPTQAPGDVRSRERKAGVALLLLLVAVVGAFAGYMTSAG